MERIPLRRRDGSARAWVLVDSADFAAMNERRWSLSSSGYAMRFVKRSGTREHDAVLMHRHLLGLEPGDPRQVDHVNGDKLDNRRSNLRVVAGHQENAWGYLPPRGRSGVRGVAWDASRSKWIVSVWRDGRRYQGGRFADLDEAKAAAARLRDAIHS